LKLARRLQNSLSKRRTSKGPMRKQRNLIKTTDAQHKKPLKESGEPSVARGNKQTSDHSLMGGEKANLEGRNAVTFTTRGRGRKSANRRVDLRLHVPLVERRKKPLENSKRR